MLLLFTITAFQRRYSPECVIMAANLRISTTILIFSWLIIAIHAETGSTGRPMGRSALLHQSSRNLVLNNHVIKSYTKKSSMRCAAACMEEDSCVSINYGETGGICELNASHKEHHPGDVVEKDGWRYYGTQEKTAETEIPIVSPSRSRLEHL